jgi:hypothetical protein
MTPARKSIALLAAALIGINAWAWATAGVDLAPVPLPHTGRSPVHFSVEAVYGGSSDQSARLTEAIATELALTGRHDAAAHRKVRIAVLVAVERAAPDCALKGRPAGQLVMVTWLVREGPVQSARKLGSVGQVQCRAPQADVWAEIALYGVPSAVKGILELVDGAGAAAVKDERDV